MSSRVTFVVPALDEAAAISGVVRELAALDLDSSIVVVDDGSSDATATRAREAGATVLEMPFNVGIGAAVQAGLRFALDADCDRIVRVDGDGQHDASDVPRLLQALDANEAGLALASRYIEERGRQTTAARRLGIRWFSWLLGAVCGVRVQDPTSGFWAMRADAAELLLDRYSADYPEVDALVFLHRRGIRIVEVAVSMREREGGSSSIHGLGTIYYMVKVTLALFMQRAAHR